MPAIQNKFIQENISNKAAIRPVAIAMNTNSAFSGSFTGNPFWYQKFDLRQIKMLRGDNNCSFSYCWQYLTIMNAMNFQDDNPSIPIDDFKDHYVLVFELTSMEDDTENSHYLELVGEPLRLELSFTQPLEIVTELIVLGVRMSSVVVDNLVLLGRTRNFG